jgi:hypothetical protein
VGFLALARLDQALQLVGVAGEPGLGRGVGLVLVDQVADRPPDLRGEAGHLVGGHLRVGGGGHVAPADQRDVADAGLLGVVEQAEERRPGGVGAFQQRQR